jgi:hypothetical protein
MIHYHNWKRFGEYRRDEFRCTTAKFMNDIAREPCPPGCTSKRHAVCELGTDKLRFTTRHYNESGCLATCAFWKTSGLYTYAAPGLDLVVVEMMPTTMVIDDEYIEKLKRYNAQLMRIAA